jgi:hypothetical protein
MTPSEYHQLIVDLLTAVETNAKNGHLDTFESKISTTLCGRLVNIEAHSDWMRPKGTQEIRFWEHRSTLKASLETLKTFNTRSEVIEHIRALITPFQFGDSEVHVTRYTFDVYLVTVNRYGVIGMSDCQF